MKLPGGRKKRGVRIGFRGLGHYSLYYDYHCSYSFCYLYYYDYDNDYYYSYLIFQGL